MEGKKFKILKFILFPIFLVLIVYQTTVILLFRAEIRKEFIPFSGAEVFNPYQENPKEMLGKKAALHIHSDNVWYTPERHSVEDIEALYKREGFHFLTFSDYGKITKPNSFPEISNYEWGLNVKKRHVNVLGASSTFPDLFPFYASRENIEWSLQKMQRGKAFVTLNHPSLYKSFVKEDVQWFKSYDAIEVFSPFGDNARILDFLLSKGIPVKCMSSDDLHYFAENEIRNLKQSKLKNLFQIFTGIRNRKGAHVFRRYVLVSDLISNSEELVQDLKKGNYFCVKKHFAEAPDPAFPSLAWNPKSQKLVFQSKERVLEIKWIGSQGKILKIDPDTQQSELEFPPDEPYVRVEVSGLFGELISNAIYRKK